MTPGAVLEFRRVDPEHNVARVYVLEAGPRQLDLFRSSSAPFLVRAWGRVGQPLRRKVEFFPSWESLGKAWEAQCRRRHLRGYVPLVLPSSCK